METREIRPGIFWVGVNDRTTDLFEGIWPLPHGISYNAYLVVGEKVALIDGVKAPFAEEFLKNISAIVPLERIAYIVVNHMEPDHTGTLPLIRRLAPRASILATVRALPMLERFYGISDGTREVSDGETLDLGGKTLRFFHIPFVHWPETMVTYEETEGVLFSCDAFGGFRALDGGLFDEEVDLSEYEDEALRYFANIVGMYTHNVLKAIEKLQGLEIRTIAPSHGLIWRRDPGRIVDLYRRWSRMEGEKGVTVVFGSMYGFTLRMAEAVARGVASVGVPVRLVDAARVHPSYVLLEVWKRRGLIVGAPTYDAGIFPPVELALRLLERKRLRNRVVGLFGSFGWGGGALKAMEELAKRNGWELVRTLPFRGSPSAEELRDGEELGREVAERVVRGA